MLRRRKDVPSNEICDPHAWFLETLKPGILPSGSWIGIRREYYMPYAKFHQTPECEGHDKLQFGLTAHTISLLPQIGLLRSDDALTLVR